MPKHGPQTGSRNPIAETGGVLLAPHVSYPERLDKLVGRLVPLVDYLRDVMEKGLTAQMTEYEQYVQEVQAVRVEFDPLQPPAQFKKLHRAFDRFLDSHERLTRHIAGMLKTTDPAHVRALAAEFPRVEKLGSGFFQEVRRFNQNTGG